MPAVEPFTEVLLGRFRVELDAPCGQVQDPERLQAGGAVGETDAIRGQEALVVMPSERPEARACGTTDFEPRVAFEIEDIRAGQALVAAGLGIALIPDLALDPGLRGVTTRDLAAPPHRRIVAARLRGPEPNAAVAAMLRALHEAAHRLRTDRRETR